MLSRTLQRIDQSLLVIAPQPGGTTAGDKSPGKVHRGFDRRAAVDQIAQKNQVIAARQNRQQVLQRCATSMNIADHPVTCS